jgi:hypothetical protein
MSTLSQVIMQQVAGSAVTQIAQRIGASEGTTQMAVQIAIPLIAAALARNTTQPGGAESLHEAVVRDHDGSILDDLAGYLGDPQAANGAGILGHVFAGQRGAVENNLAQATGLDQGAASNLLELVAPLVMGAIGQSQQREGLDATGLSNFLNDQQEQAQATAPGMMGTLNAILDSNQDGSVVDDLGRLAGKFFK